MTEPEDSLAITVDDGVANTPDIRTPIYGGDGHGSVNARQLVVVAPLADRSAMAHKERIILLDSDVRDAMAQAARRLNAEAMKYSVQGFTWDLNDIVFDHGGHRVITATLRISRE